MELIDTLRVHHSEVNFGPDGSNWHWDKNNIVVAALVMHPIAWVTLLTGLPLLAKDYSHRHGKMALALVAASLVPSLYPLTAFTSVKYAIPMILLLPFAMLAILDRCIDLWSPSLTRPLSWAVVAAAVGALLVSVEPSKKPPFLRVTSTRPRLIGTADGPRTIGAYLLSIRKVGRDDADDPMRRAARRLFDALITGKGTDLWFIGPDRTFRPPMEGLHPACVGWRHLRILLARKGYHGRWVAPRTDRYDVGNSRITLTVPSDDEATPDRTLAPGSVRVDLSDSSLKPGAIHRCIEEALARGQ